MKTRLLSIGTVLAVCLGLPANIEAAEFSWATKAPLPTARFGATTCVVDGKIYAMGGGDAPYTPYLSDVEIYDPATDSWETGIPMPNARMGHAAAFVGGKIYVMGGAYQAGTSTATVDEYDPATGTWANKAPMAIDRVFHCAGAVDGKIYIVGGSDVAWPWHSIATVEAYTLPSALSINRQGGSVTLSWTGILQEMDGQVGWHWRDILPPPTSPWTIEAADQSEMNCFRSCLP
jgi:hypothetical protein